MLPLFIIKVIVLKIIDEKINYVLAYCTTPREPTIFGTQMKKKIDDFKTRFR